MKATILSVNKNSAWFSSNQDDPQYLPGKDVDLTYLQPSFMYPGWYTVRFYDFTNFEVTCCAIQIL